MNRRPKPPAALARVAVVMGYALVCAVGWAFVIALWLLVGSRIYWWRGGG